MSAYVFFINEIPFPIAPEKMEQHYRSSTKSMTTIENGEIVLLDRKGMLEFNFTVLLPQYDFSEVYDLREYLLSLAHLNPQYQQDLAQGFYSAKWYLDLLIDFKNEAKVFTFTVLQTPNQNQLLTDICTHCVIDTLRIVYGESKNNILQVELTLLEYRPTEVQQYQLQDKGIRTLSNIVRRVQTTFYDPLNLLDYVDCGVHFLEDLYQQQTQREVQSLGSGVFNTVVNVVEKIQSHTPPLLVHAFKVAGWMAVKGTLAYFGLGTLAAFL